MFKKENRFQFIILILSLAILNTALHYGIVKSGSLVKSIINIFISVQLLGLIFGFFIALIPNTNKGFLERFGNVSLIVIFILQSFLCVVNIIFLVNLIM